MTREEAIKNLKLYKDIYHPPKDVSDSFDMAIRSLEAWDKVWKDILNHEDIWETADILEVLDKHLKEVEDEM